MKPVIIVNFKAYERAVGKEALKLANVCYDVAGQTKAKIMVSVQSSDIYAISRYVGIPVLAQHVDCLYGSYTGSINMKSVKDNGAWGTLLNHAEKRIDFNILEKTVKECKKIGLKTVVCVADINEAKKAKKFGPEFVAYEVPELIGTGRSITEAKPDSVKEFAGLFKNAKTIPLCGAGISNGNDVRTALNLGCKGVLVASAITKAKDPRKVLKEMVCR